MASSARFLFEQAPVAIAWTGPDGLLLEVNAAFVRMLGGAGEALIGTAIGQLFDPPVRAPEPWPERMDAAPVRLRAGWKRADGTRLRVELCIQAVPDAPGRVAGCCVLVRDLAQGAGPGHPVARADCGGVEGPDAEWILLQQSQRAALAETIGPFAHQWRQPMNALNMLLINLDETQRCGVLGPEKLAGALARGERLIQALSQIFNEFRDLFKPDPAREAFSALEQVRAVVALVSAGFAAAGITLRIEAEADLPLLGLRNEFARILLHLLDNARQAILSGPDRPGAVTIRLTRADGFGCLAIRDNGVGIPEALLERIFDPFWARWKTGCGLGLYLSRQILERSMSGQIRARNLEMGAEVTVLVPLAGAGP